MEKIEQQMIERGLTAEEAKTVLDGVTGFLDAVFNSHFAIVTDEAIPAHVRRELNMGILAGLVVRGEGYIQDSLNAHRRAD